MTTTRTILAAIILLVPSSFAAADAPMIDCRGNACGGPGPTSYAYGVDAVSYPVTEFRVGTNDLDPANYTNLLSPPGWSFAVEEVWMHHHHGVHTPHGVVSMGPCWCLTAGSVRWWTEDPGLAIESFVFGYDHPWPSEDVDYTLTCVNDYPPPDQYVFTADWQNPVGTGYGPLHGPRTPQSCWSNDDCAAEDYCFFSECPAETGVCLPRPLGCPDVWDPVCGCDGLTYSNSCDAAAAGMSIAYDNTCLAGDLNVDGFVNLMDYGMFYDCVHGPEAGIPLPCAAADFDYDVDVDLADYAVLQNLFNRLTPRIGGYANTGCLNLFEDEPCDEPDSFDLTVTGHTLEVLHHNATYNCCPDEIPVSVILEGDRLIMTEVEVLTNPCYCICCYGVTSSVIDLPTGTFTVEYHWFDYESNQDQVYTEQITVPSGPHVGGHYDTGCLPDTGGDRDYEVCPGDDYFELTPGPGSLTTLHGNATYNCCPDDLPVRLATVGNRLILTEVEILTTPCDCICCYGIVAELVDIPAGAYVVEYHWFDYGSWEYRVHEQEVVIPPVPYVGGFANSGCLPDKGGDGMGCTADDQIIHTVDGTTLHTLHASTTYNCCPDDIAVSLELDGNWLHLTEHELLSMPCPCMCCYDVESQVLDLAAGTYYVEYCWEDYELGDRCDTQLIAVP